MTPIIKERAAKILFDIESCCLTGTKFRHEHLEQQLEDFIKELTDNYANIWHNVDTSQTCSKFNESIAVIALTMLEKYSPDKIG